MHAVVIEEGRLRWLERPDPEPGDHELVVAVRAAGVNGADLSQRAGRYPAPPGWPQDIPGLEMAGEVATVGPRVTRFAVGDRVIGLVGGGAQAELAVVDETHALAAPAGLSWPEAGGFMEAYATAYDALFGQAGLTLGDRLLVTGAAGGVGSAAVQLAALAGAHVVASVRDPARRDEVAALGAAEVVAPGDVAGHGPYDVVLELVGAASLPSALEALALRGRVVVIGVGSGATVGARPDGADGSPRPHLRLVPAGSPKRREGGPHGDAGLTCRPRAGDRAPARAGGGDLPAVRSRRRLRALRRRR